MSRGTPAMPACESFMMHIWMSPLTYINENDLCTNNNNVLNSASFHYDPKLKQDQMPTRDVDYAKQ